MVQIDDKIVSLDVFEQQFVCDLNACKGACCVEGDSGAPLENEEADLLAQIFEKVKPFMRIEGIREVEQQGFSVIDKDGDLTTPLVNDKECAFVSFDSNGTAKCSIEMAYNQEIIGFKKPISCHLFPIRIQKYDDFEAVNYESIKICEPACSCGSKLEVPVYKFLREPLVRLYGKDWYDTLEQAAKELKLLAPFNKSSK